MELASEAGLVGTTARGSDWETGARLEQPRVRKKVQGSEELTAQETGEELARQLE